MYFCFDFLKYIVTDDFSVLNRESKSSRYVQYKLTRFQYGPFGFRLKQATPTTTSATPISRASVNEREESGVRGVAGGSKLQRFDVNPNPPTASTYELGMRFARERCRQHQRKSLTHGYHRNIVSVS